MQAYLEWWMSRRRMREHIAELNDRGIIRTTLRVPEQVLQGYLGQNPEGVPEAEWPILQPWIEIGRAHV